MSKSASLQEKIYKRILPILVSYKMIIAFGLISILAGVIINDYFTSEIFFLRVSEILIFVEKFKVVSASICILSYAFMVMFSIPAASLMTVFCGYVFGAPLGGCIAVLGALMGASALFLIVRSGLKLSLIERLKSSSILPELSSQIYQDQFRHLLFLRFFPMFPFWMINLACALLGVKFRLFFLSTFIGIIPGTFIIAAIGEEIRAFSEPNAIKLYELLIDPKFIFMCAMLSFFVIVPTILKLWHKK